MMMKRSPLLSLTLLLLAFACSKQGEGERCNLVNSSNDCEDGLRCIAAKGSNGCSGEKELNCLPNICCPPAPQRSAVAQCNQYQYGETTGTGGAAAGGSSGIDEGETGGSEALGGGESIGGSEASGGMENTGGNTNSGTADPTDDAGP